MASSSTSSSSLQKQRPLMLKDFLKEDQNADFCNVFRSASGRAADTTVRYLLAMEFRDDKGGDRGGGGDRTRGRLTASRSIGSTALTRISAVLKMLTTTGTSSSSKVPAGLKPPNILQRSLSKKLLRKSFWKKCTFPREGEDSCQEDAGAGRGSGGGAGGKILVKDIVRLGSFADDMRGGKRIVFVPSPTTTTSSRNSCSCSTSGWSEIDSLSLSSTTSGTDSVPSFFSPVPEFAKPKSPSPEKRRQPMSKSAPTSPSRCPGAVGDSPKLPAAAFPSPPATACRRDPKEKQEEEEGDRAGGDARMECTCHDCEDKDQLSPVAVMDFPFEEEEDDEDEEEETASEAAATPPSFRQSLASIERTRHQLLEKIRRFESLAHLVDPVDLDDSFLGEEELEEDDEGEDDECDAEEVEEEDEIEKEVRLRAWEMLEHLMTGRTAGKQNFSSEGPLLDFFIQGLWRVESSSGASWRRSTKTWEEDHCTAKADLSFAARQWIEGKPRGDVATREALMEEMDREGRWRCHGEEEEEIGVALGEHVLGSLLDELLLDVSMG